MATLNRREKFQSMGRAGGTSTKAAQTRTYPLRKVVADGVGADPERPHSDVDVLECGHYLSGAKDITGRRYPARRRCFKCAQARTEETDDA